MGSSGINARVHGEPVTPAGNIMKLVLLTVLGLSAATPVPEEAAVPGPLVLPYGYPGLVAYPYAVPVYPSILHTGVHYPLAEAYVHVEGDAAPAAEAYVHDVAGDVSDDASPAAEAYVHDTAGDA